MSPTDEPKKKATPEQVKFARRVRKLSDEGLEDLIDLHTTPDEEQLGNDIKPASTSVDTLRERFRKFSEIYETTNMRDSSKPQDRDPGVR